MTKETRRPQLIPIDDHLDLLRKHTCADGVCNYDVISEDTGKYLTESAAGERSLQDLIDEAISNERDRKALRLFLEHLLK